MADAFFHITNDSLESITNLCDLIHPIASSMWYLRKQVSELHSQFPKVQNNQLDYFFGKNSGVSGTNYVSAFINTSWDEHKESIAWIFLNNVFAIYEGWLKGLHDNVFDNTHGNLDEKAMQFPVGNARRNGILEELSRLTATKSVEINSIFFNSYSTKRHRCFETNASGERVLNSDKLRNLLYCYRYFKELRNCYTHKCMIADVLTVTAYNEFVAHVTKPDDLDMAVIPAHIVPVVGNKVSVDLYGVIGFSEALRKIMLTVDAVLLSSQLVQDKIEDEIVYRVSHQPRYTGKRVITTKNDKTLNNKINGLLMEAGYAKSKLVVQKTGQSIDDSGLWYIINLLDNSNVIEII